MAEHIYRTCYLTVADADLFTVSLLPYDGGKFPVVIVRNPYVDDLEQTPDNEVAERYQREYNGWLDAGYAVVYQHCRGRGRSSGDCIPYINERADGRALHDWIRAQDFYNGELYLKGGSYCTSVHYTCAPFADDIKGAIFGIQETERYNICYRNGNMKVGLHGGWYVGMYKKKSIRNKNYTTRSFQTLPLTEFTKTVFGEPSADFDEMIRSPKPTDPFWQTHNGGADARGATDNVKFPMLLTTAFNDIFTGGIFTMWRDMSDETRKNAALVVSPYDHGDTPNPEHSIVFENGRRIEQFGTRYEIEWLDSIRNPEAKCPFEKGKITYYRLFENKWATDDFAPTEKSMSLTLGDKAVTYVYNPYDPPEFRGGLSCNFGGSVFQAPPNSHYSIVSRYTEPFAEDTFVKGKISAKLTVSSDCEDTCFYMRISLEIERGDYGLRDDITSLCYAKGDYTPGEKVTVDFNFDDHAFLVKAGQRLRIDISSACANNYVRHTNNKGLYSEQTTAKIAHNTVYLDESVLTLPIE